MDKCWTYENSDDHKIKDDLCPFFFFFKGMDIKILTQGANLKVLINLIQPHAFHPSSYISEILYLYYWYILGGFTQCQRIQDSQIKNYMMRFHEFKRKGNFRLSLADMASFILIDTISNGRMIIIWDVSPPKTKPNHCRFSGSWGIHVSASED